MKDRAYLVLENGKVLAGKSFGAAAEVMGEVVFATGMTGYLETLTDPSYYGQIVVQTFPLIGNYGVIPSDFESKRIVMRGYIVRQWCEHPSNYRSLGNLDAFLREQGIPGLCDIDTRALTKLLRSQGVMNGIITSDPETVDRKELSGYRIIQAVASVSCDAPYRVNSEAGIYQVALLDLGMKENILRELLRRGCDVTVLPYNASADDLCSLHPDGVVLSNGPGDPAENTETIHTLQQITSIGIPTMGICLGHQLLALAHGFSTEKMKYGHRGCNQAVKELSTQSVYITSQNHGYAVVNESIDRKIAEPLYINVNDGTCEGIRYKDRPVFSVQFHPEAGAGPQDTAFLFDRFISLLEVNPYAAQS